MPDNDPRSLFDPATIARISRLDLRAKQVVEGFISGLHKSPFFGQSVEFIQHREYSPGDDVRHIDWKAWSRSDKFYIKQFEAETNLRATIVVDASESMSYGRKGGMSKYDYACTAAACLAYLIIKQQDSAGVTVFGEDVSKMVPTGSNQTQLDAIAAALSKTPPKDKRTNLRRVLHKVAENTHTRSLVILFSDLLTDREPVFQGIEALKHRRNDVSVFHIMDDDELNFPFGGMTRFEGMEEMPQLLCDPKALRDGYLEALEEYLVEVRRGCTRMGVDYTLVKTSDYLDAVLSRYLFQRIASKKSPVRR